MSATNDCLSATMPQQEGATRFQHRGAGSPRLAVACRFVFGLLPAGVTCTHAQSTYTPYAISTLAGEAKVSGSADGTGSSARFGSPSGVVVDSVGNIYVADSSDSTIRQVTPSGVATMLAGLGAGLVGSDDGTGNAAGFDSPRGVAGDSVGNLYVADYYNHTIRKGSLPLVLSHTLWPMEIFACSCQDP